MARARPALPSLAEDYLRWLDITRQASPHTLRSFSSVLRAFFAWALAEECLDDPRDITLDSLRGFLRHVAPGISVSTRRHKQAVLSSFCRWLSAKGAIKGNPAAMLKLPRKPQHIPQVLSIAEVEQIIDGCRGDGLHQVRLRALVEMFYSTGCRVAEIAGLQLESTNAADGSILVLGKGRKERLAYLGGSARLSLRRWIVVRRSFLVSHGWIDHGSVFINFRDGGPLTTRSIGRLFVELGEKVQLRTRLHCHTMRHTCATHLLDGGMDLRYVQEILGHSSPATTAIYTSVSQIRLREVYRRTHPHA